MLGHNQTSTVELMLQEQTRQISSLYNLVSGTLNSEPGLQKNGDILFCDYLVEWLERHASKIQPNTYSEYKKVLDKHLYPYFKEKNISLIALNCNDIEAYYAYKLKSGLSPNTVLKHHANLFTALKDAELHDRISSNPMNKVERPKQIPYIARFYSVEQMMILFSVSKSEKIYLPILFAGLLGLRRSEIVGLKWSSINFHSGTITIRDKAIRLNNNSEDRVLPKLKSKSSHRTLGLPKLLLDYLLSLRDTQRENRKKADYNNKYRAFVCVDANGNRIKLNYITERFIKFIQLKNLDVIRFHDLRHSCASMLHYLGYSIEQIQMWLGHSDIQTTRKYIHLFSRDNVIMADSINNSICVDL